MADSLYISDIELSTHIGVPEEERLKPQTLKVSVELMTDLKRVSESDDVKLGIDYDDVVAALRVIAQTGHKTVEAFAEDIAQKILSEFRPESVEVAVWKHAIAGAGPVCITIERP